MKSTFRNAGTSPPEDSPILYESYDAAYLASAPARWSAAAAKLLFGSPYSVWGGTLAGRAIAASADVFTGLTERREKPEWNVDARLEIVDERPFGRLVRFARERRTTVPRVLVVAPMSGHYATLLRGTITALLERHDVYVTDWSNARDVPLADGRFDLDDYIAYLIAYLQKLGPGTHVVAVCQPVPAVAAAAALMAEDGDPAIPRSMTLMGGPLDPHAAATSATRFADTHPLAWFENELTAAVPAWYRGAGRRVYPGFLQLGAFVAMNPDRHVDAHLKMYAELVLGDEAAAGRRRAFYDEYFSVMDMPAEFYLQTVDMVFQRAAYARGTATWRGRPVDLGAIRDTALLTVEGEDDDISAPGQTYAAHALCTGIPAYAHGHVLASGVGHYGLFSGSRWRESIAPRIAAFIAANDAPV